MSNSFNKKSIALICFLALSAGQISFAAEKTALTNGDVSFVLVANSDANIPNTVDAHQGRALAKKLVVFTAAAAAVGVLIKYVGPKAVQQVNKLNQRRYGKSYGDAYKNAYEKEAAAARASHGMDVRTLEQHVADENRADNKGAEVAAKFSRGKKFHEDVEDFRNSSKATKIAAGSAVATLLAGIGYTYGTSTPAITDQIVNFAKASEHSVPTIYIDATKYDRTIAELNNSGFVELN